MTLSLISIGLNDEKDLSIRALEEARSCEKLYAELYTLKLATTLAALSELTRRPITLLPRGDLEELSDNILTEAQEKRIGVLIGGDCLSATTHISLLLDATKKGIKTRVIHGSSIFSAVAETGLSLYKFGKTVTMPLPEKGPADTVVRGIEENLSQGLHTLILLDLDNEADRYMTVKAALETLIAEKAVTPDTLIIGAARIGRENQLIKAGKAVDVVDYTFGDPPQILVIPGSLHFLEEDALNTIAGCPPEILKGRIVKPEIDRLIDKYITSCRRVRETLTTVNPPPTPTAADIQNILDHIDRYLADAEYYRTEKKPTALTSIAYSEGILEALKLLGLVDFEW
jgi:diphthine synthase